MKWKHNHEMNMNAVGTILIMASTSTLGVMSMQYVFGQPSDQQRSINMMSEPEDMMMDMKMNTTNKMKQTMMIQMMNMMDKMDMMMDMMVMMDILMPMPMTSNATDNDNDTRFMQNHRGNMTG